VHPVRAATLRWTVRVLDALMLLVAFFGVLGLRELLGTVWDFDLVPGEEPVLQKVTLQNQLHLVVQVLPAWMLALHVTGAYADLRRLRSDVLFLRVGRAVVLAVGALLAFQFIVQPRVPTSRSLLLGFSALSWGLLFATRLAWLRWGAPLAESPYNILVVGSASEATPMVRILERHRDWGMRILGVLRPVDDTLSPVDGERVLGNIGDLRGVLDTQNVAQVFMTGRAWDVPTLRFVADACEEVGVTFSMDANSLSSRTIAL
jgi:FlaA1/EpsC-like NDP-sugar epimerase